MEHSQVVNTADLVAYQADSVISRQVLGKPTGTVTLFAFDAGQGLSEHTAPFDALVSILDGVAEVTIAGHLSTCEGRDDPHARQPAPRAQRQTAVQDDVDH